MLLGAWDFDSASRINAKQCRTEFKALLRQFGHASSDFDGAELIFGELLGNVVRHAPGRTTVRLEWSGMHPTLTVHDEEDAFEATFELPADPMDEHGRGMFIIREMAISLVIEDVPHDGTRVIAELPVFRSLLA
jgi:anti-sigma regulatory factor (Ser/Thr protein kinase)